MDKAELTEILINTAKAADRSGVGREAEFVEDPSWRKTGDFKVDCEDKKAVFLLNTVNPEQGESGRDHRAR